MSYIGIPPQANFSSGLLDRFTSTTGTTVTLTHDIASENDIVVFVNFVKQDSTTYSVGGTGNKTLTLGGTLVSSDIVEVHYLNIVGQTNAPSSGSVGSSQLTADSITGQSAETSIATDDTILIHDTSASALRKMTISVIGNTPSFSVYLNADQSLANATVTKITLDTETYDTDNAFASNKFTVPSGKAGKYCFIGTITYVNPTNEDEAQVRIHKNGSFVQGSGYFQGQNGTVTYQATQILDLSVGDYIELYGYQVSGGNISADGGEAYTNLKGFRLIGV